MSSCYLIKGIIAISWLHYNYNSIQLPFQLQLHRSFVSFSFSAFFSWFSRTFFLIKKRRLRLKSISSSDDDSLSDDSLEDEVVATTCCVSFSTSLSTSSTNFFSLRRYFLTLPVTFDFVVAELCSLNANFKDWIIFRNIFLNLQITFILL